MTPVWRIVVGISLIPAFGTLYQRLTLPEAERYKRAKNMSTDEKDDLKDGAKGCNSSDRSYDVDKPNAELEQKAHFNGASVQVVMTSLHRPIVSAEFIEYFSEWRHAKILIGTCVCWFLLDIA